MIIKYYELKNNLGEKNYYLLYGNNKGLIDETVEKILKPKFSNNIYNYDENELLNNIETFKEEILNKSFFDNDKLIIINRASDKILKTIEEVIHKDINDLKIILKATNLDKKSKLRNYFEKNNGTIIVPFYEDNNQTLLILAQNFFKKEKINISSENFNLVVERSKGDRINLKNELEKILNYCRNKKSINSIEILKLTNLAENYNISELIDQCLIKNKKKTLNILNENNLSSEDNILAVRTFLYKLKRLKKLKTDLEKKKNIDTVLSSFKPPIFWKDKDIVKKQLNLWTLSQIQNLIIDVNRIELQIKKNAQISNYIINNFILEKLLTANS